MLPATRRGNSKEAEKQLLESAVAPCLCGGVPPQSAHAQIPRLTPWGRGGVPPQSAHAQIPRLTPWGRGGVPPQSAHAQIPRLTPWGRGGVPPQSAHAQIPRLTPWGRGGVPPQSAHAHTASYPRGAWGRAPTQCLCNSLHPLASLMFWCFLILAYSVYVITALAHRMFFFFDASFMFAPHSGAYAVVCIKKQSHLCVALKMRSTEPLL